MAKRGPKPIEIDWNEFDKLCYMQCTSTEIAAWFDCSVDTIENKIKEKYGVKFSEHYAKKRENGKISLRSAQFQAATQKGNTAMLIFLGKQYLGQKDKHEIDQTTQHNISPVDLKQLADLLKDE